VIVIMPVSVFPGVIVIMGWVIVVMIGVIVVVFVEFVMDFHRSALADSTGL